MAKGAETRERILERAYRLASRDGLQGLSLSTLAAETGLSKSGLFAHFGSKEELELEVLRQAAQRFEQVVWGPVVRAPRGEARLRRLFEGWIRWLDDPTSPGGCIFSTASVELDDRPGRVRDFLVETQTRLLASVARAARIAVEAGDFHERVDGDQLAFELYSLLLGYNHYKRLLRDPSAAERVWNGFERLMAAARNPR